MRRSPHHLLLPLAGLAYAGTARAALPEPSAFDVDWWVTDAAGTPRRRMVEADFTQFLNRARCECGHEIGVEIRAQLGQAYHTTQFESFIGSECAVAETSIAGEYRRCGKLESALAPAYEVGIEQSFHPAFLRHGVVDPQHRELDDPATALAGACEGSGTAGLWVCTPTENATASCQSEEFFIAPNAPLSGLAGIEPLQYDFDPPVALPGDLSVEPGNGAVRLTWSLPDPGDIAGLRVLCEESGGGAAPGFGLATPKLTDIPDGTHYVTARNLCGDQPFSTVQLAAAPPPADPNTCGNGVLEAGEACDDGADNAEDGLCAPDCQLRVSAALHALDWDRLCSGHLPVDQDSVVIGGLANGAAHDFVLVAHDAAGNPRALARVVTATPDASLPDLSPPEAGCGCTTGPQGQGLFALSLGTLALLARRRRGLPVRAATSR